MVVLFDQICFVRFYVCYLKLMIIKIAAQLWSFWKRLTLIRSYLLTKTIKKTNRVFIKLSSLSSHLLFSFYELKAINFLSFDIFINIECLLYSFVGQYHLEWWTNSLTVIYSHEQCYDEGQILDCHLKLIKI